MNGQQLFENFKALISQMSEHEREKRYGTSDLDKLFARGAKGSFTHPIIRNDWKFTSNCVFGAVAAEWREDGKDDPHGVYYEVSRRGDLALGNISDDALANLAYMENDVFTHRKSPVNDSYIMPIVIATAVKERLRWLSRRCFSLEEQLLENKIKPAVTTKD